MSGVCAEVTKLELLGYIKHHTPRLALGLLTNFSLQLEKATSLLVAGVYALQSTADCTHYRLEALQRTQ